MLPACISRFASVTGSAAAAGALSQCPSAESRALAQGPGALSHRAPLHINGPYHSARRVPAPALMAMVHREPAAISQIHRCLVPRSAHTALPLEQSLHP